MVEKLTTFFHHLPLFSAIEIQFTPSLPNVYFHFNNILPSSPSSFKFFLSFRYSRRTLIAFLFSDMRAACKAHLIYSVRRSNKNITCYTTMSSFNEYCLWLFSCFSFVLFLFCCLFFVCKEATFLLPGRQSLTTPNKINNSHPAVQTDKYVSHSVRQLQQFARTFTSYVHRFSNFCYFGNIVSSNVHYYYVNQCSCSYEGWNFNSGNYLFTTDTK